MSPLSWSVKSVMVQVLLLFDDNFKGVHYTVAMNSQTASINFAVRDKLGHVYSTKGLHYKYDIIMRPQN